MGIHIINDIVNDLPFKKNYNVNVGSRKTPAEVDRIIDKVCEMISSTGSRAFYCKAAYKLSENKMYMCAEIALKGREPAKYLSWLLSQELRENNVSQT
jgi:hypothetical protein